MRRALLVLTVAACGGRAPSPAHAHADHPAVHGMLLFGEKTIYLSHLPLFHPPHDYQVLLAAELEGGSDPAGPRARLESDRRAAPSPYHTFVPESFRLTDLTEARTPFRFTGEVVRGHFERGGTEIDRGVRVTPRVIYAAQLVGGRPAGADYLLFGARDEAFLAHVVSGPPDFDQILAVRAPPEVSDAQLAAGVQLAAGEAGQPLPAEGAVIATLSDGRQTTLAVERQIYLERDELAE